MTAHGIGFFHVKQFNAVAIEADWPDAYRLNRYVCNQSEDDNPDQALAGFKRFPTWMWRNTEVVEFVSWLRNNNDTVLPSSFKPGLYGLDLYSLFTSIEEVLRYLDKVDPEAAKHARSRYACFDHYHQESQRYAYAVGLGGISRSCEGAVLAQLHEMNRLAAQFLHHDGSTATDAYFYAQQNARLIVNAEQYCRTMLSGRISAWNLRDQHMADTLENLAQHLSLKISQPSKIIVWAHNSHLRDARATEVGQLGGWNEG